MQHKIFSKGVISIYVISMLITSLAVLRIDSLNKADITTNEESLAYNTIYVD